ncbi:unnamed protein product [Ostreobium quekettii]|uniref:Serine-threonine/tyrosine-protein kinase catalytic domain-containing protein n=1 Tax=Ostreobium quekettii TaxID=121088 RepID=A0A8S1IND8_9CHLO|nr:unnamed protein product [Ostreobium quekettii]
MDTLANELRIVEAAGLHKNLVHCYGGCLEGPNVFIVEELMNKTLHNLVYSNEWGPLRMPLRQILRLAVDCTAGLCQLRPKIMHRNLRPQARFVAGIFLGLLSMHGVIHTLIHRIVSRTAFCDRAAQLCK